MSNIQKQHKISPAIVWLTIQKFIIFYCPLDGEHTIIYYMLPEILFSFKLKIDEQEEHTCHCDKKVPLYFIFLVI